MFKSYEFELEADLVSAGTLTLEQKLKLEEWLYKPGLPDNAPRPTSPGTSRAGRPP